MATRPRQHEIGDRGVKIVRSKAPDKWIDHEQTNDYGVDLMFQIFHGGCITGFEFGVQIRSKERIRRAKRDTDVRCRVEVSNLIDHLDKRRYPVYLFCVDCATESVYWLFIQGYLKNQIDSLWRSQKQLTLRIPKEQILSDPIDFEAQVERDFKFMQELYPGSISAAVSAAEKRFTELDPRLAVKTTIEDGKIVHSLYSHEAVEIHVIATGDDAKKLTDAVELGVPVVLCSAVIEGSPLFEQHRSIPSISLSQVPDRSWTCTLIGMLGNKVRTSMSLPGVEVTGGTAEARIVSDKDFPISTTSTFKTQPRTSEDWRTQYSISFKSWTGVPILDLPSFDEVSRFLIELEECESLRVEIRKGFTIVESVPTKFSSRIRDLVQAIKLIRMARDLALHFKVNPRFSEPFNADDVDTLHWLVNDRSARPVRHLIVPRLRFGRFTPLQLKEAEGGAQMRLSIRLLAFEIFDTKIEFGPVTFDYSNMDIQKAVCVSDLGCSDDQILCEAVCTGQSRVRAHLGFLGDASAEESEEPQNAE